MTGINQSFILAGTKGMSARVTVKENFDPLANTSDIQVGVEVVSDTYGGHIYYLTGAVAAQGQTLQSMSAYAGSHYVYVQTTGAYYPIASGSEDHTGSPWSLAGISHEVDGSKTITVTVNLTGQEENGKGANGWEVSGSVEVALTHIPRASTIAATDAVVGAVSMVAVNKKGSTYTHSIRYTFGNLTGYLTEEGTSSSEVKLRRTSLAFTLPESFYTQLLTAKSGVCTLLCKTYSGETRVGDAQSCSFTVGTDPNICAPQVTGTVTDGNPNTVALTGDVNTLVRYASNAVCTIAVTPRKEARIGEKRIGGTVVTGDSRTIVFIEQDTVSFYAKDSRGYEVAVDVTKPMVNYVRLTCNPEVKRTDPTSGNATLTVSGDCFFGSFGKVSNALELSYRIASGQWQTMTAQPDGDHYTAQAELTALDYASSYPVEVRAKDKLQTVTKTLVLGKGVPVFDWGEHDFAFHVPVHLHGLPQASTEAASKAYADRKLSVVTLWENPDTSAEFPEQLVQADLSGCAFIFCVAVAKAGTTDYQLSSIVPNTQGNTGYINSIHADDRDFWLNWRPFTIRYNGIQFGKAWMRDMAAGSVYEDWRARSVPVAIYGIKGSLA